LQGYSVITAPRLLRKIPNIVRLVKELLALEMHLAHL